MSLQSAEYSPNPPSVNRTEPAFRFCVRAAVDPSVLSRVVELFALRNLVPLSVSCRLDGRREPELRIDLDVRGLADNEAEHIARRIDQFMPVISVLLERDQPVQASA